MSFCGPLSLPRVGKHNCCCSVSRQNLLKTPQKTPKSILKQPGSESKRRRVLLISPEKEPEMQEPLIQPQQSCNDEISFHEAADDDSDRCNAPPVTPAVSRTPNIRGTPLSRVCNFKNWSDSRLSQWIFSTSSKLTIRFS